MSTSESANWYASSGQPAPSACLKYNDASGTANYLTFSVVVTEEWDGGAEVTEHPVEIGANVADHVRVALTKCELKVFNSNEPLISSMTIGNIATVTPVRAAMSLTVPMPSWTASKLSITYPTWNNPIIERALLETAGGLVGSAAGGTTGGLIGVLGAEVLAAFLLAAKEQDVTQATNAGLQPGSRVQPTFDVDQWPNGTDYVAAMHSLLVELKDSAQVFTVLGTKQSLYPMVIETLTFSRTAETGSGESVTIGLKEVRQVTTQTVPAPIPNLPAGGGVPPVSHGGQDPAPPQSISLADQILAAAESAYAGLTGAPTLAPVP